MLYGVVLPLLPLALLLLRAELGTCRRRPRSPTVLTMAALFPVYYNVLSQFVTRRDELVLKRLRTGETSDPELLASIALPGVATRARRVAAVGAVAVALGVPVPLNPVVVRRDGAGRRACCSRRSPSGPRPGPATPRRRR